MLKRSLVVAFVSAVVAGCGGDSNPVAPSPPPPVQVQGGWSGTFESNYSPEAIFVDLTQVGGTVTGTWVMSSGIRARGNISGAVDTAQFTGILTYAYPNGPTCQGSFSGLSTTARLEWTSPGFTGNCGLSAPGNPTNARFVLQRR
jgi:hypothetical protein